MKFIELTSLCKHVKKINENLWIHGVVVMTTLQLHSTKSKLRFKSCSNPVGDLRWWGSLTMVPAGNGAKHPSSVNHSAKKNHHHRKQTRLDFHKFLYWIAPEVFPCILSRELELSELCRSLFLIAKLYSRPSWSCFRSSRKTFNLIN